MLTKRQNMLETIRGGKPDRFVNQFEAIEFIWATPYNKNYPGFPQPGTELVNAWGVTIRFQENTPGPFPVHDDEHRVLKDVAKWRETVKIPKLDFPKSDWDECRAEVDKIDRTEKFAAALMAPGVFDQLHFLMGMEDCFLSFYNEPDALKELIAAITDWELEYARLLCENLHPDMIFHHDDWAATARRSSPRKCSTSSSSRRTKKYTVTVNRTAWNLWFTTATLTRRRLCLT